MTSTLMSEFPPKQEEQVALGNWRTPPFNRWAFSHVRELVPSAEINHDPAQVVALETAEADLSGLSIPTEKGDLSFETWLDETYTDAMVVLQNGKIVFETYRGEMTERTPHILMSVSKSVLGLVAGILAEQGLFDPDAEVTTVIPELVGTAYEGATLRDLLDMRAGVMFEENYHAAGGPIIEYRKAQGWDPLPLGEAPSDLRSFFKHMSESDGSHNDRFHYVSPNTDLLGWVIERVSGTRYADLVSKLLWEPMGAEHDAYITVDRFGAPRCAGGLNATARDLARIGRLFVTGGKVGDRQVVPADWIEDIMSGGDVDAWKSGDFYDLFGRADMHYRSKWYVERGEHPMAFGVGIFGQNVFVEPGSDIVIAKFSSMTLPLDADFGALTHAGVDVLRAALR